MSWLALLVSTTQEPCTMSMARAPRPRHLRKLWRRSGSVCFLAVMRSGCKKSREFLRLDSYFVRQFASRPCSRAYYAMEQPAGLSCQPGVQNFALEIPRSEESSHLWIGSYGGSQNQLAVLSESRKLRCHVDRGAEVIEMIV